MRTIQTFVLRLLTSSDEPQALHGVTHAVTNSEEQPFTDGASLLALLRQMLSKYSEGMPPENEK